jgi:hypothetical protein
MKHGLTIKTSDDEDTALIISGLGVLFTFRDLIADKTGEDILAGISKLSYGQKEDAPLEITWRDAEFGKKAGHVVAKAWEYVTWGCWTRHYDEDGNEFESDGRYLTEEEQAQADAEWKEMGQQARQIEAPEGGQATDSAELRPGERSV